MDQAEKRPIAGNRTKWRVMVELTGSDGTVHAHEVSTGGSNMAECSAATVGLTLADGKRILAGLQDHLVQAQTRSIAANAVAALIAGRNDRSRMSARGGWSLSVILCARHNERQGAYDAEQSEEGRA
jgi:hypothetical protein